MKRLLKKSRKHSQKSVRETEDVIGDGKKQMSPSGERPKSGLIKGLHKRLSVGRTHNTSASNASNPEEIQSREDCDYSTVWNDEPIANGVPPRSPQRTSSNTLEPGCSNIYTSIPTSNSSEHSPKNPNSPTTDSLQTSAVVPSAPSIADLEISNLNNSNITQDTNRTISGLSQSKAPLIQPRDISVTHPLMKEFHKLARKGWYWGPLGREQAEQKLHGLPEASFLIRDSSDDRYLLSLSFRSNNRTLHTRIEHSGLKFSFYVDSPTQWHNSVIDLIESSMRDSNQQGIFCYSRTREPDAQTFPVRLMHPVSRFTEVRPLQDLCRFVIRQYTRIDHIQNLPLPKQIKGYLNQSYF